MDDAELTAFGTGVGGPSRLFNREICDDHRTVYTGGVRVIACTLHDRPHHHRRHRHDTPHKIYNENEIE